MRARAVRLRRAAARYRRRAAAGTGGCGRPLGRDRGEPGGGAGGVRGGDLGAEAVHAGGEDSEMLRRRSGG